MDVERETSESVRSAHLEEDNDDVKNVFIMKDSFLPYETMIYGGVILCCNGESAGLRNRRTRVRTPVALLRSLSDKQPWDRY